MEQQENTFLLPWHRIFGISLSDYFTGTLYKVEMEKDLSIKQQFLDVVIIEAGEGRIPAELPDGLENLAAHNLLTYKSHQEALNGWTLYELSGHYVNYRKQVSPSLKALLPEKDFQLYAVSTRYPAELMKNAEAVLVKPGIYDIKCPWDSRNIRLIVLSRISKEKKNAIWHLFSARQELIEYGASEYQWRTPVSSIINNLLKKYNMEGVIAMPYTIQDYMKDYVFHYFHTLTPEQIERLMKEIPVDERLKGISIDELLEKIPVEKLMEKIKSKGLKNNK
ncbi:Uncharacterized protein dnl_04220 [Desulfonema limicola]|uniref:Uncharacterized protein n=1 Tax=Desulfonema limicola TaxID=45656 RepID=A0A975B3N6_9BACT|nr:hypothetical protein [Desulfonema limicola]QTA78205.1 Uncharacterized protein dnl_04220 [Desulfonema limicola]